MKVVIDKREEEAKGWAERIREQGVEVEVSWLDAGDFLLRGGGSILLVERKGIRDLVNSVVNKRLFAQLDALSQQGVPFALMITGDPLKESRRISLLGGREGPEGLKALFSELGLDEARAGELARISLALAARRTITGSDIAAACRSHGLGGLENLCVAVLKAAEVISPILSSTWPSGDARYRTCRFLGLLAGL